MVTTAAMGIDARLQALFAEPLLEQLGLMARDGGRPVFGLNGPVGAGKTSLCQWLQQQAGRRGLRLAVASIDDFYLPWPDRQQRLAGNPFGVSRVPPGSHDTALLRHCLSQWQAGEAVRLPRFDKTLRDGQGDRCGEACVEADALVLEGWLVGCQPLGPARLERLASGADADWRPRWDGFLADYTASWQQLDQLWLLRPQSWSLPRRWRFQAEARQRRRGGAWLPGPELQALVDASLLSLPPALYQQPLEARATAVGWLDGRRRCQAVRSSLGRDQPSSDSSSAPVG